MYIYSRCDPPYVHQNMCACIHAMFYLICTKMYAHVFSQMTKFYLDSPHMQQNICAPIIAVFEIYKFYLILPNPPYMQHMLQHQQLPLSIAFSSSLHSDFWMRFEIPN